MTTLVLRRPDDFHIHLRDGAALARTVPDAAAQCARALVMPNLTPAVDTIAAVTAYRERIMAHVPQGADFTPLMTLYLSDSLTPDTVRAAKSAGVVAIKWYPKGATTNSAQGVASVEALYPVLEIMEEQGFGVLHFPLAAIFATSTKLVDLDDLDERLHAARGVFGRHN